MDKQIQVGVVIIGRNEGERLISSIKSIIDKCHHVVYVDSASTDNSVKVAKELGAEVVILDMSLPFTAARARNAGFKYLRQVAPKTTHVQFVDGDCEVIDGWIQSAIKEFEVNPQVGVVCGRRMERFPEYSVYNRLCDLEWNTPIGNAKSCGGDFMIRTSLFQAVGGFDSSLIAGEEPEMCLRIKRMNWDISRIDVEMTKHDANIRHFSQWWYRNMRCGHAFAEGMYMHGCEPERYRVIECVRVWLWGFLIPISILILSVYRPILLLLLLLFPLQILRLTLKSSSISIIHLQSAFFVTLGKFPEFQGQIKFLLNKLMNKKSKIIEYK